MVFGDVRNHRNVRADARERFQLKARNLHHRDVVVPHPVHARRKGQADVSAGGAVDARRPQNFVNHRHGGRLAVGARDRDERRAQVHAPQLRFADDALARLAEGDGQFMVDGDARAQDEHVAIRRRVRQVFRADSQRAARVQLLHRREHRAVGYVVVHIHRRAARKQKLRPRNAALGHARH